MKRLRRFLVFLGALLVPALAFAEEGEKLSPFAGDVGNVIWTLVVFVLLVWVLGRYAWRPLLDTIHQREEFIRSSLAEAKRQQQEAEARLAEYEERLARAHAEATAIVEEGRRDADAVRARIEQTGREEAEKMIARARKEIELATQTAVSTLYRKSADLATEIAGRLLKRELSEKDHERLVSESLEELERLEGGN